jgi:transcriptional regulator with XRE-family HTH domain
MSKPSETQKRKLRKLLRDLREEAGLRQVDVATRMKRPQSFVSKYESGEMSLGFLEVKQLSRILGVSFADFVRRYEEEEDES